jgi:subtilisin family serine protease
LIVVKRIGLTDGDPSPPAGSDLALDAIRYILDRANGSPVVINMSFSSNIGPRDGSNAEAQAIDDLLTLYPNGVSVIRSAGNQSRQDRHAKIDLGPLATETLLFRVPANDEQQRLNLYYQGGHLTVRIRVSAGSWQGPVANGDPTGTFAINNGGNAQIFNTPDNLWVRITPQNFGAANVGLNQGGLWELELTNTSGGDTEVHAYSDRDDGCITMVTHISNASTVPPEAAGEHIIVVGAHSAEGSNLGELDRNSGQGPVFVFPVPIAPDPAHPLNRRPHLTAPGVGITAPQTESNMEGGCCCDCCYDAYANKTGTSMATPHVAGAAAILLGKNPQLTYEEVREHLVNHTQSVSGEALPNNRWGTGRLDVKNAFDAVADPAALLAGPGNRGISVEAEAASVAFSTTPPQEGAMLPYIGLRERWMQIPGAATFDRRFRTYFHEVRALINTNQRVAVVWHRNGGPQMIRMAFRAAATPELPLAQLIEGPDLQSRIERFRAILLRYASPELAQDIDRYQPFWTLLYQGPSLSQLLDLLEQAPPDHAPLPTSA